MSEGKRLKALEDENGRLERMLADSMLDNAAVKDLSGKSGDARGTTGGDDVSRQTFEMSERRACRVIGTDRTSVRIQGVRAGDEALREWLKALAQERRRFGYRRLHVLLRREGHAINRKRVQVSTARSGW